LLGAVNLHNDARERRVLTLHPQANRAHAGMVDLYAAREAMVDRSRQVQNQRIMVSRSDPGIGYQGGRAQLNADFRSLLNGDV
jgi:hypothetical protein